MPKVSVIIPTFNYAQFLATAVRSVLSQTYTDLELIIVDDGSTDNTQQIAKEFESDPRVQYMFQTNRGDAAARNTGIRQSSGEYLAFLDSDDSWLPEKLQLQIDVLEKHENISVVYCAVFLQYFDQQQLLSSHVLQAPKLREKTLCEELLYDNPITGSHSSVMVRRAALDQVGLFDEAFHICDVDLWRRLAEHHEFFYVPEALVCIIKHGAGISRNREMMAENHVRYFKKLERELPQQYRHHLPRIATLRFASLAFGFLQDGKFAWAGHFGFKTLVYAWRCPIFSLGLIPWFFLKLSKRT